MRVTRDLEANFRARVLQDCLSAAIPAVWERRAAVWEDARPRPGDFNGRASRDELIDRDRRCRGIADACRRHARILSEAEPVPVFGEVLEVLQAVA